MMREKIVSIKKQNVLNSKNHQTVETARISIPTDSMIQFLLKEEIIKV